MPSNKYNFQKLDISPYWKIVRNVFYDIDPNGDFPNDDKESNIYSQETLLYTTKDKYHLDLGWYGYDNLANDSTGYCIHLFRGKNWNDSELLECFRSKNKQVIVNKIAEFLKAVDLGDFDKLKGYRIDENDKENINSFNDFKVFSARITI